MATAIIDVDECSSSPCQNGATCTESSVESSVSFHAYQCTCVAGFANGVCEISMFLHLDMRVSAMCRRALASTGALEATVTSMWTSAQQPMREQRDMH